MTLKEALEDLKSIHYNKHGLYTNDEPAREIAFNAIEYRIPKKPNFGMAQGSRWRSCPACCARVINTYKSAINAVRS